MRTAARLQARDEWRASWGPPPQGMRRIYRKTRNVDLTPFSGAAGMDLGLHGAIVLITGGSKGLGLACAQAFLAEGAGPAFPSRSHENRERARPRRGGGDPSAGVLSQPRAPADMVDAVERRVGPV